MGLRERNAERTRAQILEAALDLFVAGGYEATTMEDVARAAEVSASTLYRYFPTKEQLVSEPLALRGQMAAELASRPAEEPLDVALGHAVAALIRTPRADNLRLRHLLSIADSAPGPQARLRAEFVQERVLLQQAVARRLGRDPDDVVCQMTARVATSIVEILGDRETDDPHGDNAAAVRDGLAHLADLLDRLHRDPPTLPRLTPTPDAAR